MCKSMLERLQSKLKEIDNKFINTVIISFIHRLLGAAQIYIAFYFFFNGIYLSYFIIACVFYGIKVIHTTYSLSITDFSSGEKTVVLIFLDIVFLDFFSPFLCSKQENDEVFKDRIMMICLYLVSILLQDTVYFFALGIIADETIGDNSIKIICYLSYVLRVILITIVLLMIHQLPNPEFYNYSIANIFRKFMVDGICQIGYILSVVQIFLLRDNFSINLGFYYLAIILLFNILQTFKYGLEVCWPSWLISFLPIRLEYFKTEHVILQQVVIFQYLYSMVNLCFIICYSGLRKDQELIMVSNIVSLVLNSLYLLYNMKGLFILLFQIHRFEIIKKSQAQDVIKQLTRRCSSFKQSSSIVINIFVPLNTLVCQDQSQSNNDCVFFQLQKCVDLLKKKVKLVKIHTFYDNQGVPEKLNYLKCECSIKKLLLEEERVNSNFDLTEIKLNSIEVHPLILERSNRGLLFTPLTNQIVKKYNEIKIDELKQNVLLVTAFNKHIRDVMICHPTLVLYDLYI